MANSTAGRTKPASVLSPEEREGHQTAADQSHDDETYRDGCTFGRTKPVSPLSPEKHERFAAYERKYFNRKNKNCHGCDICLVDKDLPGTTKPASLLNPEEHEGHQTVDKSHDDKTYRGGRTFGQTEPVSLLSSKKRERFAAYERKYFNRKNKNCHGCDICLVDKNLPGTTKPASLLNPEEHEGHQTEVDETHRGERTFGQTKPVSLLSSKTRGNLQLFGFDDESTLDDINPDDIASYDMKPRWLLTHEEQGKLIN
ncbi:hypothetical protein HCN44_002045 [Aphidius gifuensis]|uniref:Uncharacterized protein n=1 Tax=Aphidius gifuensis TaxID=684658 RepID=A0A834Y2B7_APHGI|nr:hypothetical protein HCN44_002045 [Aphidius gifuensis]